MKKYSLIIAAVLVSLASCTKADRGIQDSQDSQDPQMSQSPRIVNFLVNADEPEVKASLNLTEGFLWSESTDATRFRLFTNYGAGTHVASTAITVGGDKRASVTASVAVGATKAYLYYGDSYNMDVSNTQPFSWFNMDASQTQNEAGTLDNTWRNMILMSDPIDVSGGETSVDATLHMLTSLVCFNIYASEGSSETVSSVALTAQATSWGYLSGQVHGRFPFDASPVIYEFSGVNSNTVTVGLTNHYSLSGVTGKGAASGIFMGVMPTTITGYVITVTTNENTYEFRSAGTLELQAGKIKPINIDLKNASPIFTVDKTSHSLNAIATSATINVTAFKAPWTAEVHSGSASVSPSSGTESGAITVTFTQNESTVDTKVCVIRVSTTAEVVPNYYDITITQAVAVPADLWTPANTSHTTTHNFGANDIKLTDNNDGNYQFTLPYSTGAYEGAGTFCIIPTTPISLSSAKTYTVTADVTISIGTGATSSIKLIGIDSTDADVSIICQETAFSYAGGVKHSFSASSVAGTDSYNIKFYFNFGAATVGSVVTISNLTINEE